MVDNWIRLGLVEVDYLSHITDLGSYSWIEENPAYIRAKQMHKTEGESIIYGRGVLEITELGKQFARAVGLQSPNLSAPTA
jgi:hypothetical protein